MQKFFKKMVALFAGAMLLETPAPARVHTTPAPTPEPPLFVDATEDRSLADAIRFRVDSEILHIWFPSVQNADEAILICGDKVWLIDCGEKRAGRSGAELLRRLGITKIDKLFISHPHHDHLNGLRYTNEAAHVEEILFCFPHNSTAHIVEAIDYAGKNGITVSDYGDGDVFTMGDTVTLKFWYNDDPDLDMNNNSASTLVQCGSRRFLFTADMEQPGQEVLLSRVPAEELRADLLKYPHHGKSALLDAFDQAVSPLAAVVTNSAVEWDGVLYLDSIGLRTFFTHTGTSCLHFYTDGNIWVAEQIPIADITPEQ